MQSAIALDSYRQTACLPAFGAGFTTVIPDLGEAFVPVVKTSTDEHLARLALGLVELHPALPLEGTEDELGVMKSLLEAYGLKMPHADTSITLSIGPLDDSDLEHYGQKDAADEYLPNQLGLCIDFAGLGVIDIEKRLLALYEQAPKVAEQVMAMCDFASEHSAWIITPNVMLDIASQTCWGGENDEIAYLEAYGYDDDEEREHMQANMLCRAEFDVFPDWMLEQHQLLPLEELTALVADLSQPWQPLGAHLLKLASLAQQIPAMPGLTHLKTFSECCAYHCFLTVSGVAGGFLDRVMDDHYQMAQEMGCTEITAITTFTDAKSLTDQLEAIQQASIFQGEVNAFLQSLSAD